MFSEKGNFMKAYTLPVGETGENTQPCGLELALDDQIFMLGQKRYESGIGLLQYAGAHFCYVLIGEKSRSQPAEFKDPKAPQLASALRVAEALKDLISNASREKGGFHPKTQSIKVADDRQSNGKFPTSVEVQNSNDRIEFAFERFEGVKAVERQDYLICEKGVFIDVSRLRIGGEVVDRTVAHSSFEHLARTNTEPRFRRLDKPSTNALVNRLHGMADGIMGAGEILELTA